jgi:uncharacterized protein YjiS (DUF1127 family)
MTTRTDIRSYSPATPGIRGMHAMLFGRLVNHWIAGVIARCERQAARVALRQLDDRELKDIGIYRHQLGDAFSEIARDRLRLQRRGLAG